MSRGPRKRCLKVTEHRTKQDWALFMQEVLEEQYPEANKVVVVLDNLNTHTPTSFYEVFPPEQAKALIDRLEIHYTPKHASWLNIAEIELSVLARQGLAHNITTIEDLCRQVQSWQDHRNQRVGTVNWQFRIRGQQVTCIYHEVSELDRVVGYPGSRRQADFTFSQNHIATLVIHRLDPQERQDAQRLIIPFFTWIKTTHPAEWARMSQLSYESGATLARMARTWAASQSSL